MRSPQGASSAGVVGLDVVGAAARQAADVVGGAAVSPLTAHDHAGARLARERGVAAVAGAGGEHAGGGALEEDLLEPAGGDAQQGDGPARGERMAVVGPLAHGRGAGGELLGQLVMGGLLVAGVLRMPDDGEVGGEAEEHGGQNTQRRPRQGQTGARGRRGAAGRLVGGCGRRRRKAAPPGARSLSRWPA
ncbi:hypothetical protein [Streptomyces sp. PSAA01]|uniref:hypothetical protein n=1 Tax=Streptomyces sp. PSAA01 TaxID=2912762 RepID=UPI001F3C9A7C|nr:hypothetical protein [Streptomyces sp. PSAA01]MCG0288994.1 hypothetical protein [Streptomyces sp. PSAA01]